LLYYKKKYTKENNLFAGVLYQYFEGHYYERYYRITDSITILFVRGEREKKNKNKTDILRVVNEKRYFYFKKNMDLWEKIIPHLF
jgi:hypothetical protein